MSDYDLNFEVGFAVTHAISMLRFLPATNNYDALVTFPYLCFEEYVPDAERQYERGQVVRESCCKYLIQNDGVRIDVSRPLREQLKLFRDSGRYDEDGAPRTWVREEYCLNGFQR